MKKIALVCLLMAQILGSCAQESKDITPYNDRLNQTTKALEQLEADFMTLRSQLQGEPTAAQMAQAEAISAKGDSLLQSQIDLTMEVADKFRDTKEPAKFVAEVYEYLTFEQLEQLCNTSTGYYNDPLMERPKKMYAALKLRRPGSTYKDLTMNDPSGKQVKLSQWVGKGYVLVDFWASWCGPCRAEMPNVVESYKRYHSKGYKIVGVSFDQQKGAWTAAIEKLGMTWPQMSDLKGWECAAHEVYGVNSIPSNVLIDPQGKIVAADLRGEDLLNKLAEIYK